MQPGADDVVMRLRAVGKRYGRGAYVFQDVDLELAPGTLTLLSGPNGAGKSTLLRIIAGASRPSSGMVSDRPEPVGYVPDRLGASAALTGRHYLALQGQVRREPARAVAETSERLSARLGFEGSLDTGIGRLSKGNTRKLALIQALLSPPRLLVLDEPFAGLDQATAASVNELLKDEVGNGGAVILCDHERRAAVPVDQHAELAGGRLHRREPADAGTPRPRTTAVVRLDPAGRRPRPELPVLEGILRIDAIESDVVSAWVEREHTDAFLAAALAAGWSVRSVRDDSGA